MINDFWFILTWWLVISLMGLSCLPLTLKLFAKFFDKGYIFSKIIGLLGVTFVVWLAGSTHLLAFSQLSIFVAIVLLAGINLILFRQFKPEFNKELKSKLNIFVLEEIILFITLTTWSFVRGYQPDIQGLEKFMDFGFLNSILISQYFPPNDMWLAGNTINYYYFGHLFTAVLTKLSGLDPAITYNLMIATIMGFTFSLAFSLGGNLICFRFKKNQLKYFLTGGLMCAILLTLGGNLHPLYQFLKFHNFDNYWYPDATRFIVDKFGAADNTIHEFPIYSYVVADLHGHMLDIPAVILFLSLLLAILTNIVDQDDNKLVLLILSILLAIMYMTSTWDFAIYLLVFAAVILLYHFLKFGFSDKALTKSLVIGGPVFILSLIFSLPFNLHFKNIAGGIALTQYHTPPWMLLVLWGWPILFTLVYLSYLLFERKRELKTPLKNGNLLFESREAGVRTKKTTLNIFNRRFQFIISKLTVIDIFIIGLLVISWLLIFLPEVIYVKDIYIQSYQRANTMFKFTYQSFVMFAFIGTYILFIIIPKIKIIYVRFITYFLSLILLTFILIYPYFAVKSYYGLQNYKGLYGINYLNNFYKGDFEAIKWLNSQSGSPIIVEAVGESYTDFARISSNTGLPTLLGWRVHEWLWRGSFDEPAKRTEDVRQIYESTSDETTKQFLQQYNVKYVIIGNMERKQYPGLRENKFKTLGKQVFSSNGTTIYEMN